MFNFHKPKVYRSTTGCCICKAKSSSSRFTDSKKYEEDFIKCFNLVEPRKGEICNACVLLVKRFKKLPPGSERNWKHVVDARAGPGMKSMAKFKSKSKKLKEEQEKRKKKHHHHSSGSSNTSHHSNSNHLHLHDLHHGEREGSPVGSDGSLDGNDDALMAEVKAQSNLQGTEQKIALEIRNGKRKVEDEFMICDEGNQSGDSSSRTPSPGASDSEDTVVEEKGRRRKVKPVKRPRRTSDHSMEESDFIDPDYWKKEMTCCGPVYRGVGGETLVDVRFHKPCKARLGMMMRKQLAVGNFAAPSSKEGSASPTTTTPVVSLEPSLDSTGSSDSSSDSGYDESSNQGVSLSAIAAAAAASSKEAAVGQATGTSAFVAASTKNVCTDSSTDSCLLVGQINDGIKITNN